MATKKPSEKARDKTKKKKTSGKKRTWKEWLKAVIIAIVIIQIFKSFVGLVIVVSDSKMEKGVLCGDFVYINKLAYGPRLPITPLTFPLTESTFFFTSVPSFVEWIELPAYRLPGYSEIKNGDVIALNYPYENDNPIDHKSVCMKRCIASPGDTLRVYNKKIYINEVLVNDDSAKVQNRFRVVTKSKDTLAKDFWQKYNISEGGIVTERVYDFNITLSDAYRLANDTNITDVRALKLEQSKSSDVYFPNDITTFLWNPDYLGPLVVPSRGDTIELSLKNIAVFHRIIETYERNTLEISGEKILINGKETKQYVINQNYYFVMDDNRDNAKDSRYWGFVPEDHIIGRASFVVLSFDSGKSFFNKIRWNRIFSGI